jgi:hypothetical protein
LAAWALGTIAVAQAPSVDPTGALSDQQWRRVEQGVGRALAWIASQQLSNGSFPTHRTGQPAITSMSVMAFLSYGHLPGQGPYGKHLDRAIDYVLSCQRKDGLISLDPKPDNAAYNHSISGLMLTEVYGMGRREQSQRIQRAVERALAHTFKQQGRHKPNPGDQGGWRYLERPNDNSVWSDLSVTSWQLMFLRSAKNAGFEIDPRHIDEAMDYVKRLYYPPNHTFSYALGYRWRSESSTTRGMTGAGILSLSLGGLHDTPMALAAADWLLAHPYDRYNSGINDNDVFHYGAYYYSHAMHQIGGRHWAQFFPILVSTLLDNQSPEGAWRIEAVGSHAMYGNVYTTAMAVMAVMALTVPCQLLPIYQR